MVVQERVKYNKIVMLVHPLYNVVTTDPLTDFQLKRRQWRLNFRNKIRIYLREYGKALIEASKDPNTFFVIVKPNLYRNYIDPTKKQALYDVLFERFETFAKRLLGKRLYVTNYDPHRKIDLQPIFLDSLLSELSEKVDLESFGEFTSECVKDWRKYLEEYLVKNKIKIGLSETNERYSVKCFSWFPEYITTDCLDVLLKKGVQGRKFRKRLEQNLRQKPLA